MLITVGQGCCLSLADKDSDLSDYGEVVEQQENKARLRVPRAKTSETVARILQELRIDDLTVEDPPIEDVIEHVLTQKSDKYRIHETLL